MKKNDLQEIKKLDEKALIAKAVLLKQEVSSLVLDKNTNVLKDARKIFKVRKDLAQILTVLRQKQLITELRSSEEKGEVK